MRIRLRLKLLYLRTRARIVPWCMLPGCWERSHVLPVRFFRGKRFGGRGNACPVHVLEALMRDLADG
jgi:hypothetical protein